MVTEENKGFDNSLYESIKRLSNFYKSNARVEKGEKDNIMGEKQPKQIDQIIKQAIED